MDEQKPGVAVQARRSQPRRRGRLPIWVVAIAAAAILGTAGRSAANTLLGALSQAYQINPQLNAQRAIRWR
jgi:hypothetical protein